MKRRLSCPRRTPTEERRRRLVCWTIVGLVFLLAASTVAQSDLPPAAAATTTTTTSSSSSLPPRRSSFNLWRRRSSTLAFTPSPSTVRPCLPPTSCRYYYHYHYYNEPRRNRLPSYSGSYRRIRSRIHPGPPSRSVLNRGPTNNPQNAGQPIPTTTTTVVHSATHHDSATTATTSSSSSSSSSPPLSPSSASNTSAHLLFREVDVLYGQRHVLVYDATLDRYVSSQDPTHQQQQSRTIVQRIQSAVSVALLPSGVTPNYYRFIRWRIVQRYVNANLHVFGTQSLLMGLGIQSLQSQRALSAALNWVLKDALGKLTRMVWASKMGRRFDSDAKRWRFRSAIIYAMGNALEIVTYLFPQWFLIWATCANSLKQVSMLTSSSTRTAIYNSFRDNKSSSSQNIGDITAKGEAQIAMVDLLGIASGVTLSRAIGTSAFRICFLYTVLQICEIGCMYRQLRAVQYRVLNFERLIQVTERFCDAMQDMDDNDISYPNSPAFAALHVPTPSELAITERLFWPPPRLARRGNAFGSLSRAKLSPDELSQLLHLFRKERFLLVVGPNLKRPHIATAPLLPWGRRNCPPRPSEQCHIVLHEEAGNVDIVKGTLALALLRRRLEEDNDESSSSKEDPSENDVSPPSLLRTRNCLSQIEESYRLADKVFARYLRVLSKEGWESPARFMFGRVHMRADWPLVTPAAARAGSTNSTSSSTNPNATGTATATTS